MSPLRLADHVARMKTVGAVAIAALVAACAGETGTLSVSLVTAPGSTVLDTATHARITLTAPRTVVEADRNSDGSFDLVVDVPASGGAGALVFEAFDSDDNLVAVGRTPGFPVAAITADIAIYVAAPMSLAPAPVALSPAKADVAVGPLAYGALLAGGRDADGDASRDVMVYDAYQHQLSVGAPLPVARAGLTMMVGTAGYAYMFGGDDDAGTPSGLAWRFDTNAAPAGEFLQLFDQPAQARSHASAAPLGLDKFLVAGTPSVVVDGFAGTLGVVETPPALAGQLRSVEDPTSTSSSAVYTVAVGDGNGSTGVIGLVGDTFTDIPAPASALRTGHGAAINLDAQVIVVGGSVDGALTAAGLRVDPIAGTATEIADLLATPRTGAAVAIAGNYLVVAGGTDADGTILGDAEVFDAITLAPVAIIPLTIARTGAAAQALTNGQLLFIGGIDTDGAPVGTLELFTPPLTP